MERSAKAAGFSVGRTGQFGIGILSYFMIADRLEVATRRSQHSGDPDATGWRFVIEGLSDFGELSKLQRLPGSDIRLRLKPEMLNDDPRGWVNQLWRYLSATLRWMPCAISIDDEVFGLGSKVFGPGWTDHFDRSTPKVISAIKMPSHKDGDLYTEEWRERFDVDLSRAKVLKNHAARSLRWTGVQEFFLPEKLGNARISLPYFELDGANSVAYLSLNGSQMRDINSNVDFLFQDILRNFLGKDLAFRTILMALN